MNLLAMTSPAKTTDDALGMFFPDTERNPYYIIAPPFTRFSAGIKVLHTLCHLLNIRGQIAFVLSSAVNPDLVTPFLTSEVVNTHYDAGRTPVIVYPEMLTGNPLNGSCVARYLLNIPGRLGVDGEFGPNDILIWYSEHYRTEYGGSEPILEIPTSDARVFFPPPAGTPRHGSCFYAAKFKLFSGEKLLPLTRDSFEIPHGGDGVTTPSQLADLFRRSEVFYAYEPTALGLEATLCGCPCVNLPSRFHPRPPQSAENAWPGVVWGDDPGALASAKQTVDQSRQKYNAFAELSLQQLDDFIEVTQREARRRPYETKIILVDPYVPVVTPPPLTLKERGKNAVKGFLGRIR